MSSVSKWPARAVATAGAFAFAMLIGIGSASAETTSATCDFLEIKATSTDSPSMDKSLPAQVQKKLKRGPFKAHNNFQLWGKQSIKLAKRKAQRLKLKAGELEAMFRSHSKPEGKKDRVNLSLDIDDKNGSRVLETKVNVDAGDFILVGRTISDDVDHIIAVTCKVP
jgi:hypothetical protein